MYNKISIQFSSSTKKNKKKKNDGKAILNFVY